MSVDKKIEKAKSLLAEAQAERARKKVLYDSQVTILEGQRRVVIELEQKAQKLQDEYNQEHNKCEGLIKELKELTEVKSSELDNNGNSE